MIDKFYTAVKTLKPNTEMIWSGEIQTEDDFNKVIDKWVNKDLFDKVNGRWQPTFTIK